MKGKGMKGITRRVSSGTLAALAIGILAFTSAPSAKAVPTITISDGTKKDTVTLNNASGLISFNGSVGKFSVSLSTSAATGLQMLPSFNLSSLTYDASGKKSAALTISLSDTSVHPNDGSIASQVTGQTNGVISYSTFGDTSNKLFGNGTLLSSNGALSGNFSGVGSAVLKASNPFSMTETFVVQLSKGGNAHFSATVTDPPSGLLIAPVPETGSTLAFLGLAFLGLEAIRRRLATA
jgi:hypothetical protein